MDEYHKIQTVWLRDPKTNFKTLLEDQWSKPEFEVLKDLDWLWTEKVDGTNIRVIFDSFTVLFLGKTDAADTPAPLLRKLNALFPIRALQACFPDKEATTPITLYGEGYGVKIQKGGGRYIADGCSFILFDVKVGNMWLTRESVEDIGKKLGIAVVPICFKGPILRAIQVVRAQARDTLLPPLTSRISSDTTLPMEGLVGRPPVELFNRIGQRIITKIKVKDFSYAIR